MENQGRAHAGAARLDGLLDISYPPDPGTNHLVAEALQRLRSISPVVLDIQSSPGSIKILPDGDSFTFDAASRPSQMLLPAIRDLVEPLAAGPDCRVESTLRVQEFLGETVMEGVFIHEEDIGIVFKARERPIHPDERPTMPEPSLGLQAESLMRKYQWPLLGAALVFAVLGYVGWQMGWFAFGGSVGSDVEVDLGPLEQIVAFERVRKLTGRIRFEILPGPEFARLEAAAAKCSLRPGLFRVLLGKKDEQAGVIVPLDLSDLPEKVKALEANQKTVRIEVPYSGPKFDHVVVCR
jgi:hypothetical protein